MSKFAIIWLRNVWCEFIGTLYPPSYFLNVVVVLAFWYVFFESTRLTKSNVREFFCQKNSTLKIAKEFVFREGQKRIWCGNKLNILITYTLNSQGRDTFHFKLEKICEIVINGVFYLHTFIYYWSVQCSVLTYDMMEKSYQLETKIIRLETYNRVFKGKLCLWPE